jgi:hypothetical protein
MSGTLKSSRWMVYSVILHVSILVLLIGLSHRRGIKAVDSEKGPLLTNEEEKAAAGAAEPLREIHIFDGTSYTEFTKVKEKEKTQKTASSLLGKLKNMNLGGGANAVANAPGLTGAAPGLTTKSSGSTLTSMVQNQKITLQEAVPSKKNPNGRKMSDQERLELKRNFKSLESELRKVYGRALTDDPHLNVTIAFEAEIQTSGYLALANFKARGKYEQKSADMLKTEMSNLLGRIFVAKDLSGARIRGESVFMR